MLSIAFALTLAALPVRYDPALVNDGFPSPVVDVTVAGQRAVFLVDTGAGVHTLARWFVTAAGLQAAPSTGSVTGSTGDERRIDVVAHLTAALSSGARVTLDQFVVADLPELFERHRIAGLLSPQLIAGPGREAVLELTIPRLAFRSAGSATAHAGVGEACVNASSPFRNRLYSARIRIDDRDATLLLDTGATRTTIAATRPVGVALQGRSVEGGQTQGVGGAVRRNRRVTAVAVTRGGAAVTLDLELADVVSSCGPDGLLGMDALRRCTVVLGEAALTMTCKAER